MLKLTGPEAAKLIERLPEAQREAIEQAIIDSGSGSKYGNRFVIVGGEFFHSEGEYKRACERDLKPQEARALHCQMRGRAYVHLVRRFHLYTPGREDR
jgi:hypothetical protein